MVEVKKRVGVMLDIETLGLTGKAVVTQLAFLAWDQDDDEKILREVAEYLPIGPQLQALKREISASTLLFWMRQSDAARAGFEQNSGDDYDELVALVQSFHRKLTQVIEGADEVEIWARGPQFDITIIESLFADLGLEAPWKYDQVMDLRTTMKLAGIKTKDVEKRAGLVNHVAIDDCFYQLDCLAEARRRLRAKV